MRKAVIIILGVLMFCGPAWSITPLELKEKLSGKEPVTLIDIRNTPFFQRGHIPGAINIPGSILSRKRLPDFKSIVVYGDGIRTDITENEARDLSLKKGVPVDVLEGGFAAWQSLNLTTTQSKGISKRQCHYLNYKELKQVAETGSNVVLLDLRESPDSGTDLARSFPGVESMRMKHRRGSSVSASGPGGASGRIETRQSKKHEKLYILIDDGNGKSEETARRLGAAGVGRVAILIGGEQILTQEGAPKKKVRKTIATFEKK